jgi:hypothetical protein
MKSVDIHKIRTLRLRLFANKVTSFEKNTSTLTSVKCAPSKALFKLIDFIQHYRHLMRTWKGPSGLFRISQIDHCYSGLKLEEREREVFCRSVCVSL